VPRRERPGSVTSAGQVAAPHSERCTDMQEALKNYLAIATGLSEVSKKRAKSAAKKLAKSGGATAQQVQALTEDLLATGLANRESLVNLVRYEVDRALGLVGLATQEEVEQLTSRIRELERALRAAEVGAGTPDTGQALAAAAATARTAPVKKAVAKKTVAKKTVATTPAKANGATAVGKAAPPAKKAATAPTKTAAPAKTAPTKTAAPAKTAATKTAAPAKTATKAAAAVKRPAAKAATTGPAKKAAPAKTAATKTAATKTAPAKTAATKAAPAKTATPNGAQAPGAGA